MANWGNALMAVLVDDRFNGGLPANLTPEPGVNSGFKGMQLSITSLACAVRQMAGPSSIHSLPTEQYNQDVVSLGMHAAVTAMDALECVRNLTAMLLMAAAQAVDLRGGPARWAADRARSITQCARLRSSKTTTVPRSAKSLHWPPSCRGRKIQRKCKTLPALPGLRTVAANSTRASVL